jgi:hypothetical protein
MEIQMNTPPLISRRNKAAICLHEKLLRLEEEWDKEPVERLKTRTTFITEEQKVKKQVMGKEKIWQSQKRNPISTGKRENA